MEKENPFRCCLYCGKEIEPDRHSTSNFCRYDEGGLDAECREKFRRGFTPEEYHRRCEINRRKPIRNHVVKSAIAERLAEKRRDNNTFHKCKLGEFKDTKGKPLCNAMFMAPPNTLYCPGTNHRDRYNSLKTQERIRERRNKKS
jgi:hypothetical protein